MFHRPEKPTLLGAAFNNVDYRTPLGRISDPILLIVLALYFLVQSYDRSLRRADLANAFDFFKCSQVPSEECNRINSERRSYSWFAEIVAVISLLGLTKVMYDRAKKYKTTSNIPLNHKIALDFVEGNPTYPSNYKKVEINCPITLENTSTPALVAYKYKDKDYAHAYDYKTLIEWFQEKRGLCDPYTNINLLDPGVTEFKLSFDIPEDVLKKFPPEIDRNSENKNTI